MKLESLSKNVVKVIQSLSKNEGLARLLLHNVSNPNYPTKPEEFNNIARLSSEHCKIFPYPFDPEAQIEDECFIRVYYNDAEFSSNETISETRLHIDIICAKSLWLINDGVEPMVRPYEVVSRVISMLGRNSMGNTMNLKFDGMQHLAVNTKFDAIRLYSEYFTVEPTIWKEEE
jgi:hypothetical protein